MSLAAFDERGGFAIECGTVQLARFQIKLVDHNLNQRRGGDSEKNSEQSEQFGGRQREEQDVDRMQSHFFADHTRHKNIQLNLINQQDHVLRQPEFCRTHA